MNSYWTKVCYLLGTELSNLFTLTLLVIPATSWGKYSFYEKIGTELLTYKDIWLMNGDLNPRSSPWHGLACKSQSPACWNFEERWGTRTGTGVGWLSATCALLWKWSSVGRSGAKVAYLEWIFTTRAISHQFHLSQGLDDCEQLN